MHFDSAGSALPPEPVLSALTRHLALEAKVGGYRAESDAAETIEQTYRSIATLIGCQSGEVALVENATRAWDMVFYAFARRLTAGDRILTSVSEYASNYIAYLQVARASGVSIEVIPNDERGALSVSAAATMLDAHVKLISITHVPTNGGLVNPACELGRLARSAGIPYLIDACQSVGQLPVDVDAIGCDFLSATGRKYLRGPRGTGFLYVRQSWIPELEPIFLDLHAATWTGPDSYEIRPDARRFENWESYVAGRVGLGAAADYALALGVDRIAERVRFLAARMRNGLRAIPGVQVRDLGLPGTQCGIVSFTCESFDSRDVQLRLQALGICVSASRASSTRLDMTGRGLTGLVRASVHCYNNEEEIDAFCATVGHIVTAGGPR